MYELELAGGILYLADKDNHCIRKIHGGQVSTHAGKCKEPGYLDGTALQAKFRNPYGLSMVSGTLFVADTGNHCIRKVSAGRVTTVAGHCMKSGSQNGSLTTATFKDPKGVAADSSGKIYVADWENNQIRLITP